AKHGYELLAGPLDESDHSGVGILVKKPGRCQELAYISEEGRQARQQGRFFMARVDTAKGYEAVLMSVYCWSGGNERGPLRDRTNSLLRAMRIELRAVNSYPVIISMDLNGDIHNFAELEEALSDGELWDMGSVQHWDLDGDGVNLPTCRGHGSRQDHRRDYMLCNAQALPDMRAFRRGPFGQIDVHTILYAALHPSAPRAEVWRHCKPKALTPSAAAGDDGGAWEAAARAAIEQRMRDACQLLDGNARRRDTEALWRNWSRAYEEGLLDALGVAEESRAAYRGHGQVVFRRWSRSKLAEAIAADGGSLENPLCPPGGHLRDRGSANCAAAAARRLGILATLATRQVGGGSVHWTREMRRHV
ncbi:hypothetical protein, partial [Limnohabitans sp.]|uniref:hypothetical protein n=1 Tax=Limnohabitans sp. TaxID=1907725 RepID=UPI00334009D4